MKRLLCALLICGIFVGLAAQSKKGRDANTVRKEQTQVKQQIGKTQQQIEQNKQKTLGKLNELNSLNAQIAATSQNIEQINASIVQLQARERSLSDSITAIEKEIGAIKTEYAKCLRDARKRRQNLSELSLIFSSESFNSALKRSGYIRQLRGSVDRKATSLKGMQTALDEKRTALTSLMEQQKALAEKLAQENAALVQQKGQTQALVDGLKREASTLNAALKEQQQRARQLDAELNRIIQEEIRRAEEERRAEERRLAEERKKAEAAEAERQRLAREKEKAEQLAKAEAEKKAKESAKNDKKKKDKKKKDKKADKKKKEDKTTATNNTPKPQTAPEPAKNTETTSKPVALSGSFASNKGNLLFPVAGKYSIVSQFGVHQHENLPYVQTDNSGIDIEATPGANARSVYDGEVSSIFYLDGYNNVVMVRHGEYLTVYANIDRLNVKKGEKVKAGQTIGQIYSDSHDKNRTILHFEVRRETAKLNPLEWVRR